MSTITITKAGSVTVVHNKDCEQQKWLEVGQTIKGTIVKEYDYGVDVRLPKGSMIYGLQHEAITIER